jgi:Zn-dependent protease with chaperone function
MNTTALYSTLLLGWLVDYYLLATLLLLAVCLSWRWIRQPAHRITAAWIVMIELLALAVVCALPFWPRISLVAESSPKAAPLAIVQEQSQPVIPQRPLLPVETMHPLVDTSTIEKVSLPATPPAPPAIPWTWQEKAAAGYGAAAALIFLWLGWGAAAAWRICRNAKPADESLLAELSAVAGDRPRPRLLVSPRIANAVALGVFRPTIVLPVAMAEKGPSPTLRAVLAHECAHVRHRDLWLLSLGRCLLPLLFAHPLFWWLRRAIRSDQELLADAFAAGEQRQNYAEELLRLVRNAARGPMTVSTAVGLWEGSSQISRRIAMLLDETFRIHPTGSRRWKFQALGLLLIFGGACSLLTLQPARSAEEPKQPPAVEKSSAAGEKSSSIKPGVTTVNSGTLVITGTNNYEENERKDVLILPGYEILARPQVVRELNLTDEQMSKLHQIQQSFIAEETKYANEAQKAKEKLSQAELDAALKKRIRDRKADIRKQVEAVLTSEQWQKIDEIVFLGKVFSWCLHVPELKKIGINDLTKEQSDELRLLQTKHGENLSKQSQTAKEKILSHLSPDQRAKAHEAALGPEGFVGSGGGVVNIEGEKYLIPSIMPYSDFGWSQVQQELGLTADQKKQVRDILGGSVNLYARLQDEVPKLSAEEKKMSLLSNASSSDTSVNIATKPTDSPEERKKQEAERLEMLKKDIARRRTEWESKPLVKLSINLRKQFEAVLTPEQLEKYKEMAFQKVFDFQLSSPPVMEKLGLSEEQRTAIQKIEQEKIEDFPRFSREMGANILKVLTPAQQAKLRDAIRRQEAEALSNGGNDEGNRDKSGKSQIYSGTYVVTSHDIEADSKSRLPANKSTPASPAKESQKQEIAGRVKDDQGKGIAGAEVGLQVWPFGQDELPHNPFLAVAKADADGRFRLQVPDVANPQDLFAIVWAFAEGYQPARPNGHGNLSGLLHSGTTVKLSRADGTVLRILNEKNEPASKVRVTIVTQMRAEDFGFSLPHDWYDRLSGVTDAEGQVRIANAIPGAIKDVLLQPIGQTAAIHLDQNFFLNYRPEKSSPHFTWALPATGNIKGRLEVEGGKLPDNLKISIQTESKLSNGLIAGTSGEATAAIDAEGRFRIDGIAAGAVIIRPFLADNQPLRAEIPSRMIVREGETTEVSIPVRRGVLVRGQIRKQDTKQGYPNFDLGLIYGQSASEHRDMYQKYELHTDKEGRFSAVVPPGPIELRLHSAPRDYQSVEWWRNSGGVWGSRFIVPSGKESHDLEPIELVPAKSISGKLIDFDNQPLNDGQSTVYGTPDIPGKDYHEVMSSFAGVPVFKDGGFSGSYPSTYPPEHWTVSHRRWKTPHESTDDKWEAKILSHDPFVLQVPVHRDEINEKSTTIINKSTRMASPAPGTPISGVSEP